MNNKRQKLLAKFDEAVMREDEIEAILFSRKLLEEGELVHVMFGFKKLAKKGCTASKKLYAAFAYRSAYFNRPNEKVVQVLHAVCITELKSALDIVCSLPVEDMAELELKLRCELSCWYILASRVCDSSELSGEFKALGIQTMQSLDMSTSFDWMKEYRSFIAEHF